MFHNLAHNSYEPAPDSSTLLPRDHLVKWNYIFHPCLSITSLSFSLTFFSLFLLVAFSFLNPVYSPPQIESQWPVDFGGTRLALADPPTDQPTDLPRRSHFPLGPALHLAHRSTKLTDRLSVFLWGSPASFLLPTLTFDLSTPSGWPLAPPTTENSTCCVGFHQLLD